MSIILVDERYNYEKVNPSYLSERNLGNLIIIDVDKKEFVPLFNFKEKGLKLNGETLIRSEDTKDFLEKYLSYQSIKTNLKFDKLAEKYNVDINKTRFSEKLLDDRTELSNLMRYNTFFRDNIYYLYKEFIKFNKDYILKNKIFNLISLLDEKEYIDILDDLELDIVNIYKNKKIKIDNVNELLYNIKIKHRFFYTPIMYYSNICELDNLEVMRRSIVEDSTHYHHINALMNNCCYFYNENDSEKNYFIKIAIYECIERSFAAKNKIPNIKAKNKIFERLRNEVIRDFIIYSDRYKIERILTCNKFDFLFRENEKDECLNLLVSICKEKNKKETFKALTKINL